VFGAFQLRKWKWSLKVCNLPYLLKTISQNGIFADFPASCVVLQRLTEAEILKWTDAPEKGHDGDFSKSQRQKGQKINPNKADGPKLFPVFLQKKTTTAKKLCCAQCHSTFTAKCSMMRHVQNKHPSGRVGRSSRVLTIKKKLDVDEIKIHGCEFCGFKSSRKDTLDLHVAMKHLSRTIPCPDCDKMFSTQIVLGRHQRLSHVKKKCQHCGYVSQIPVLTKGTYICYTVNIFFYLFRKRAE